MRHSYDESIRKARAARERALAREAAAEKRAQAKRDAGTFKAYALPGAPVPEDVRAPKHVALAFGFSAAVPKTAKAAWGARMIFQHRYGAPDVDFVMGRNDMVGDEPAMAALKAWLDGVSEKILAAATLALRSYTIRPEEAGRFVIYEDATGIVVGNTNASHGYLYVAGWLKENA